MKKKVLHVSAGGLNPGGVGTVIFAIVEALHEQFDFSCVVFSKRSEQEKRFEKYGKLYRINCYPRKGKRDYFELLTRPVKLYFGIRKICRDGGFDVIHCHNQRDEWICLLAAKHELVSVRIAHSHVTKSPKKYSFVEKTYKNLSPAMLRRAATVKVGCSRVACEQLYLDDDFTVIPNSIDLEKYSVSKREEHDGINFVHVGRFNYAKNQEFVIEAFAQVHKRLNDTHLYLIGYGEESDTRRLEELIDRLGVSDCVEVLPGDLVDVAQYYARSDYMIFPSRFEGFGIVLVEAQAMGVQCYVSENIQPEADLGLLHFLRLSDGPEKWAEYIVDHIKSGERVACDPGRLEQFGDVAVCARFAELYRGTNDSE